MKHLTVAITGASGAIYAQRLLHYLDASLEVAQINLVISALGATVIREELDLPITGAKASDVEALLGRPTTKITLLPVKDVGATIASGSYPCDGMAVVPCSMGSLGYIAAGIARDLIHRAADVMLKERRPLILVPRETPFNAIHLENMLRVERAGALILPACPSFYHRPQSVQALVDHLVFRIMAHLGVSHPTDTTWRGRRAPSSEPASGQV
ncbi:MAG: UbiX family flavin prenyltransferase [Chloracidobacterium sp.]|uniref:UbiX family flavin prenyltransferase n=1 Tax=Chloracidobacterium validum TaxID=2821543 RepID=UPI001FE59DAF|nr:UbiX family flavin prenyltransferase [Chloracidobacterium validum]